MEQRSYKVNTEDVHNPVCSPLVVVPPSQGPSRVLPEMNASSVLVIKQLQST